MTCYRNGGCGPYEQTPCCECPASHPEYATRQEGIYKIDATPAPKEPVKGSDWVKFDPSNPETFPPCAPGINHSDLVTVYVQDPKTGAKVVFQDVVWYKSTVTNTWDWWALVNKIGMAKVRLGALLTQETVVTHWRNYPDPPTD